MVFPHRAKWQVDGKPKNSNWTAICQHQGLYGQMFNSVGECLHMCDSNLLMVVIKHVRCFSVFRGSKHHWECPAQPRVSGDYMMHVCRAPSPNSSNYQHCFVLQKSFAWISSWVVMQTSQTFDISTILFRTGLAEIDYIVIIDCHGRINWNNDSLCEQLHRKHWENSVKYVYNQNLCNNMYREFHRLKWQK